LPRVAYRRLRGGPSQTFFSRVPSLLTDLVLAVFNHLDPRWLQRILKSRTLLRSSLAADYSAFKSKLLPLSQALRRYLAGPDDKNKVYAQKSHSCMKMPPSASKRTARTRKRSEAQAMSDAEEVDVLVTPSRKRQKVRGLDIVIRRWLANLTSARMERLLGRHQRSRLQVPTMYAHNQKLQSERHVRATSKVV